MGAVQAAPAADPLFKPLIDMRLRYENVDQAGFANEANVLTMRVRAGFSTNTSEWFYRGRIACPP